MRGREPCRTAASTAITIVLLLAGCGTNRDTPTDAASPAPVEATASPADDGSEEILLEAGATEEEARCIAAATADAPAPDAANPDGVAQRLTEAITTLADDCAPQERLEEIGAQAAVLIEEEAAAFSEPLIEEIAGRYEAAGSDPEGARCIAEVLLAQGRSLSSDGNAEDRADEIGTLLAHEARHCGPPQQLRRRTFEAFVSPLVSVLANAGASQREASCIVDSTESIEIFLPSEDFNGPDSAEMAGDRFVENAGGCAPPARLRQIVRTAFKQYIEGCSKSSPDPMAPYDCLKP